MHVSDFLSRLDPSWFLQLLFTLILLGIGFIRLLKNTASKYFEVDANFDSASSDRMPVPVEPQSSCASCGSPAHKKCSRCKLVKYCSQTCQSAHWKSGHKTKCKDFVLSQNTEISSLNCGRKASGLALVPSSGTSRTLKQTKAILFPYDEFVELFNWDMPEILPCGLLNTGNSCYANVILQCLTYTQPLTAYLLGKGHRRECRRDDWCFLCVLQTHIERVSQSPSPFSPLNILSRLRYIGGSLGSGDQEDAHEFMRFAIDTMQSVCLDEFGGEKAISPSSQDTTLIQHIFGGHLQSQVVCSNCNQVSNQYENMMDLTVEIQGDASTLEECLEQFTVKEWLHGDNMYKCDGCNDYVKAWKRLTVRLAPNILTIALKRFRGGRFGKLNKKISFPETLDLSPFMSESGDGRDIYKLYAVVVHLDLLNAAYFGHYVCYTKDFRGHWHRIDDEKVLHVEPDEVLSQGAYMLLYRRVSARTCCLRPSKEDEQKVGEAAKEAQPASKPVELMDSESDPSPKDSGPDKSSSLIIDPEYKREGPEDMEVDDRVSTLSISKEVNGNGYHGLQESTSAEHANGFVSHHISSSKQCFNKSSNVQVDPLSADFTVEDGRGSTSSCATGAVSMVSSAENTMSLQNGVGGDAVASPAIPNDGSCLDGLDRLENGKVSMMPNCSRSSVGNIAKGEASCRTKLKPLFSPGFLEKRPRNKLGKREVKSLVQTYEHVSSCAATTIDRGLGNPKLPKHEVKDEGVSLMDCNGEVPSLHILEPDRCPNKDDKIDIHERDPTRNGEHSSETPAESPVDAGDKKFCDPNGICYNSSSSSYSQGC